MRYTRIMKPSEVFTTAVNIKSIEEKLGHKIPDHMLLDIESLSDHTYNPGEAFMTAHNIKRVEDSMHNSKSYHTMHNHYNPTSYDLSKKVNYIPLIVLGALASPFVLGFIYYAIASIL